MSVDLLNSVSDSSSTLIKKEDDVLLYDIQAECQLLGMLIRDNNNIDQVENLSHFHFYAPLHQKIFSTINLLIDRHKIADISFICAQLDADEDFIANDGRNYIKQLIASFTLSTAKDRADIIYNLYLKRRLIEIGKKMASEVSKSNLFDLKDKILQIESDLFDISNAKTSSDFEAASNSITEIIKKFDIARKMDRPVTGLPSGFIDLDAMIGGFKKTDLIILAARPSMGKTALAVTMALNIARTCQEGLEKQKKTGHGNDFGGGVAFFSLEMSKEQIALRIASMYSEVNSRVFTAGRYNQEQDKKIGRVSDGDFDEMVKVLSELNSLPLYIDDTPAISISSLISKSRRIKKRYGISMIIVDYLQLIRGYSANNRVQEISEVTQGLKALAKELQVPVIALSQLSRAVESRDDKKPQLSDLRESGSIEQDVDIVMFLYRAIYYHERSKPEDPGIEPSHTDMAARDEWLKKVDKIKKWQEKAIQISNLAEVIVAKNRSGSVGHVDLAFDASKTKFTNRVDSTNPSQTYIDEKQNIKTVQKSADNIEEADLDELRRIFGGK